MENNPVTWALIGVAVGALLTGISNYILLNVKFKQKKEMYHLENLGRENVKKNIRELLSHKGYTDRSFKTISSKIGGYRKNEIRKMLHEIDAEKAPPEDHSGEEWWYLHERKQERIEKRKAKRK